MIERELKAIIVALADLRREQHVILRVLAGLTTQGDALLMISQELKDAMKAIDDATNSVASRITDLSGQITTAMTPAEVQQVVDQLNGEASKLQSIAANPEEPVPPGTTEPTP